jgi:hypothetical protein
MHPAHDVGDLHVEYGLHLHNAIIINELLQIMGLGLRISCP